MDCNSSQRSTIVLLCLNRLESQKCINVNFGIAFVISSFRYNTTGALSHAADSVRHSVISDNDDSHSGQCCTSPRKQSNQCWIVNSGLPVPWSESPSNHDDHHDHHNESGPAVKLPGPGPTPPNTGPVTLIRARECPQCRAVQAALRFGYATQARHPRTVHLRLPLAAGFGVTMVSL